MAVATPPPPGSQNSRPPSPAADGGPLTPRPRNQTWGENFPFFMLKTGAVRRHARRCEAVYVGTQTRGARNGRLAAVTRKITVGMRGNPVVTPLGLNQAVSQRG